LKEVATKWGIYENAVQSYRTIFISSQSFILVVGVLLFEKSVWLFMPLALISLLVIWYIWFPVVKARHRIVDYYKYALELTDEERAKLSEWCTEKQYVNNIDKRREFNKKCGPEEGNWRLTRKKIDLMIPCLFTFLWLLLMGMHIGKVYNNCDALNQQQRTDCNLADNH